MVALPRPMRIAPAPLMASRALMHRLNSTCSIWIRSTLPRVRYDRLMTIGWKVLLPLATVNLLVTSAIVAYRA